MVLESLVSPLKAESHPGVMFIHGFIYASLGIFLGMWIFSAQASLIMVFLTTMAAIPLIYNIIKMEEKKDLVPLDEKNLLKEHSKALKVYMYYFLGSTLGFAFCYVVLSPTLTIHTFNIQTQTLADIRGSVTGHATSSFRAFSSILANNLKVLIFCILFSFLYGVGAIFILTWNASVIGVAIGDIIKTGLYEIERELHLVAARDFVGVVSYGLFRYSLHGIPEIGAYLIAGLSGGIISTAAIRHDFGTKRYEKIILDSSVLLILSLFVLIVAAFLEVYVTPLVT